MSITLMTERPPYIKFEMRAIEDRNASLEHGRYMTRDVDYVIIMAAGAKDSVEHEAKPWLDEVSRKARQGQYNKQHADYFAEAYTTWKQTQDTPLSGSPIKEWTVLTPSERENLLTANMRTVEDLAVAPEDALMKIGMGARSLKEIGRAHV